MFARSKNAGRSVQEAKDGRESRRSLLPAALAILVIGRQLPQLAKPVGAVVSGHNAVVIGHNIHNNNNFRRRFENCANSRSWHSCLHFVILILLLLVGCGCARWTLSNVVTSVGFFDSARRTARNFARWSIVYGSTLPSPLPS